MKVSIRKAEYMCLNERKDGGGTVQMSGVEVSRVDEFKYLESTIQNNGERSREVKRRLQAASNG